MILKFFIILFSVLISVVFVQACYASLKDHVIIPWKKARKTERPGLIFVFLVVLGILIYVLALIWFGTLEVLRI